MEAKATLENISQSMALSPCPPLLADKLEENLEALHLYARYRQTEASGTVNHSVCAIETRHLSSRPLVALTLCVCLWVLCCVCLSLRRLLWHPDGREGDGLSLQHHGEPDVLG